MTPRLGDDPVIEPDCEIENCRFGRFVKIARGTRLLNVDFGSYSYTDRMADLANAEVGKFSNIASFARIGPTDHPMGGASLHHFQYRSPDFWPEAGRWDDFFAHRASRITRIGHDTWIGHMAMIRPELTVGHGAVVAMGAVVTKDVAPYTIVAGNPARLVRRRHPEPVAERLMALAWWDWDHARIGAALADFRSLGAEAFLERHGG